MKNNDYKISKARKTQYMIGNILQGIGLIMFFGFMIYSVINFTSSMNSFIPKEPNTSLFILPVIGIVLVIVGAYIKTVASRGTAGSGLILDPEKAREDLKPHTKAMGGMINDALEEVDIPKKSAQEVVKIRCPECKSLNDETAQFCSQCGNKL